MPSLHKVYVEMR